MKAIKLLSLLIMPLFIFSLTSCRNDLVQREIDIKYLRVTESVTSNTDVTGVEFESEAGSKILGVKTSFTFIDIESSETWAEATLNDDNTALTVEVDASDLPERTATITLIASDFEPVMINIVQSSLNDVRIPVTGATPASPNVYNETDNPIGNAYDLDAQGNGNAGTWWLTPQSGNVYPYDFIFHVASARMDYLIYTPKQHTNASNVNGCLGRVEIWWTSAADPATAGPEAFTKYGEYNWEKSRALPGRTVTFSPALENVTGVKFRIMEPGGGTTAADGWAGIGDVQFWKNGAGKAVLGVSSSTLSFDIDGGEPQTVNVSTSNVEGTVSVTAPDGWCRANLADGVITVTVDPNTAADATARTSRITVSAGDLTKEITVSQAGPQFSTNKSALLFQTEGGEQTVTVTTNLTGIQATKPSEDTWYEATYAGNTLTIDVDPASAEAMHTSEVTLTASNGSTRKVMVAQKGLNDYKLDIDHAWAQTFNSGNEVEKSYDGDEGTWYMAGYQSTFPVDVVYYFRNVGAINHFIYHAKTNNVNGRLGRVEIFYATKPYPIPTIDADFTSAGVYDWEKSADIRVVKFPQAIENPTAVKLRILETGGGSNATTNYAGIKEIEFYKIGNEMTPIFTLSESELDFEAAAGSKDVTIDTNLTGTFTAEAEPGDTWCTPTVNGTTVSVAVTAATTTRSTTVTVTAPDNTTRTIAVTQTVSDIKLAVTGAKPDTDDVYSTTDNPIEKAWDVDGDGKPILKTWWITSNTVAHEYPYDVVFYVASDRMDYLVYSAKQHDSASNVNGCLGRVEIWWTSVADPATATDGDFTQYGGELDWEHARTPIERRVDFSPALTNVTAIKLRLMEPGAPGSFPTATWAGIGDMSFFKKAM